MEERIDNEIVQQIDLISMLKDIGREWLTILLLSISAALFADIWICATYQPEYKTSTTFVVTAKGIPVCLERSPMRKNQKHFL